RAALWLPVNVVDLCVVFRHRHSCVVEVVSDYAMDESCERSRLHSRFGCPWISLPPESRDTMPPPIIVMLEPKQHGVGQQVPRRGTCKCVYVGWGVRRGAGGGEDVSGRRGFSVE